MDTSLLETVGLVVLSYAGGAVMHTTIAYRAIKKEAERSRTEYLRLISDELLPRSEERITAAIAAKMPAASAVEIPVEEISAAIGQELRQMLSSAAGADARRAQSSLEQIVSASMTTGNPFIDGIVAMIPPDVKRELVRRWARMLRQGGLEAALAEGGAPPQGHREPSLDFG